MTTNIHYLIAAMAVLLVVIWQYSRQRQMDDRNSLMFRRLLSVVSLDVAAELVSTGFILYAPYSYGVGRMLSNTVFYLFQALLPLLLLYYVCTLCTSRVIAPTTVLRMGIPTIALVFIILTNPFTEILFYFDSTGYRHGPWYLLLYVSALLHIAGAAVFVAVHRASVSRRTLTELLAVFALAALGIAAQAVNPSVLTTGFGLSLSILAMYLTINNPCACMDSLTGLNDKQYLLRRMDELTDAHKAFHIITVYAYQLDHINKVAGVQNGDEFLRRAAERMQEIADRNVFRISGKRFLLMTFSLREYETCLTRLRQLFHTQPDDAQAAPTPVILCGVVNAEKLGTSGLVLDYAEYLESLVSRSGETQVIQNDRKTMDSFHYNKQVEQFLHRAIAEDLFEVYYQPVYSLHQQRFVTLEALSRLRHPELGWISPDIFIRLAEKNHLITQITELQLRRVCRFLCENPALRASIANVKINLSPLDLIQSESGSHLRPHPRRVRSPLLLLPVRDHRDRRDRVFREPDPRGGEPPDGRHRPVSGRFRLGLRQPEHGHAAALLGHQARPLAPVPYLHGQKGRPLLPEHRRGLLPPRLPHRRGGRGDAGGDGAAAQLERGHDTGLLFLPSAAAGRPAAAAHGERGDAGTGSGVKASGKNFSGTGTFASALRLSLTKRQKHRRLFEKEGIYHEKNTPAACMHRAAGGLAHGLRQQAG